MNKSIFPIICAILLGSFNVLAANVGTGLPISGDGTSEGSLYNPTYKNPARIIKITAGIMARIISNSVICFSDYTLPSRTLSDCSFFACIR